jgi:hypothetical protein
VGGERRTCHSGPPQPPPRPFGPPRPVFAHLGTFSSSSERCAETRHGPRKYATAPIKMTAKAALPTPCCGVCPAPARGAHVRANARMCRASAYPRELLCNGAWEYRALLIVGSCAPPPIIAQYVFWTCTRPHCGPLGRAAAARGSATCGDAGGCTRG